MTATVLDPQSHTLITGDEAGWLKGWGLSARLFAVLVRLEEHVEEHGKVSSEVTLSRTIIVTL